jgi:hypothetical protein
LFSARRPPTTHLVKFVYKVGVSPGRRRYNDYRGS